MTKKICYSCKQEKPVECFSRKKNTKDGLNIYCKECVSIQSRKYREAHKEAINERKRADYWKSKERAEERTAEQLLEGTRICKMRNREAAVRIRQAWEWRFLFPMQKLCEPDNDTVRKR